MIYLQILEQVSNIEDLFSLCCTSKELYQQCRNNSIYKKVIIDKLYAFLNHGTEGYNLGEYDNHKIKKNKYLHELNLADEKQLMNTDMSTIYYRLAIYFDNRPSLCIESVPSKNSSLMMNVDLHYCQNLTDDDLFNLFKIGLDISLSKVAWKKFRWN
jgi:hypothetical protein